MSITLAILIPGLLLLILGLALASGRSTVRAAFQSFPRSPAATVVFFGTGALCFLYRVWNLSPADFGEYRTILTIAFAAIALLAFKYTPDFLAVRGGGATKSGKAWRVKWSDGSESAQVCFDARTADGNRYAAIR